MAIKWWLGLDTSGGSLCSLCPDTLLDPLGHHATTCKHGGDVVFRHNRLRTIVAESSRLTHLSVKVEARNDLTPDHSHTRPADVFVLNWSRGCVTSPLNTLTLSEAGVCAGAAAQAGEVRKQPRLERPGSSPGWRGQEAAQAGEARKQPRLERPGSSPGWRGQEAAQAEEARKQPRLERPGSSPGWRGQEAAQAGEVRKHSANDDKCVHLGWVCVPLVTETYGSWGPEVMASFFQLASRLAIRLQKPKSVLLYELLVASAPHASSWLIVVQWS